MEQVEPLYLSAEKELEAGEEFWLCLRGLGLLSRGLQGLAVVRHRNHVQFGCLQILSKYNLGFWNAVKLSYNKKKQIILEEMLCL